MDRIRPASSLSLPAPQSRAQAQSDIAASQPAGTTRGTHRPSENRARALLQRNIAEYGKTSRSALARAFRSQIDGDARLKETFAFYKGNQIVEEVEKSGNTRALPPALIAELPGLNPRARYMMKRAEIQGKTFGILYEIDQADQAQVVGATAAERALLEAVDTWFRNAGTRVQQHSAAAASGGTSSELPAGASEAAKHREKQEPEPSASKPSASHQGRIRHRQQASLPSRPVSTFDFGLSSFPSIEAAPPPSGLSYFPALDSHEEEMGAEKAESEAPSGRRSSPEVAEALSSSRRRAGSPSPSLRVPSRASTPASTEGFLHAVAGRLVADVVLRRRGFHTDSSGMLTPNPGLGSLGASPGIHTPAESIRTLASIEEVVPEGEKVISGVGFAKRMEKLLKPYRPWVTGAVKESSTARPDMRAELSLEEMLEMDYILTREHRFMAAWLDALGDVLADAGIDVQRDRIDEKLREDGGNPKDLDQMMRIAAANALRYGTYSTPAEHGPGQTYERTGDYFRSDKELLANFNPRARETFALLHDTFEHVPGFKDLSPEQRFRYIVDPQKTELLKRDGHLKHEGSQLLMFLCDYDREYAYRLASAIPVVMDKSRPVGLDLFLKIQEIVAAGSTAFDSMTKEIRSGLCEEEMSFWLYDGLHLTPNGERELHEFAEEIEMLKHQFMEENPDLEMSEAMRSAMEKPSITIHRPKGSNVVEYRRCMMPEAFLRFCINHKVKEAMQVVNDESAPVRTRKEAAVALCKFCENLHGFMDGNGRVFEMLTLQRLYHDIDGSLPMPKYPGVMDGHALAELLDRYDEAVEESRQWRKPETAVA